METDRQGHIGLHTDRHIRIQTDTHEYKQTDGGREGEGRGSGRRRGRMGEMGRCRGRRRKGIFTGS